MSHLHLVYAAHRLAWRLSSECLVRLLKTEWHRQTVGRFNDNALVSIVFPLGPAQERVGLVKTGALDHAFHLRLELAQSQGQRLGQLSLLILQNIDSGVLILKIYTQIIRRSF